MEQMKINNFDEYVRAYFEWAFLNEEIKMKDDFDIIEECMPLLKSYLKMLAVAALITFIVGLFIGTLIDANAQTIGDGVPEPDRDNPEFRLVAYENNGINVFDYIQIPGLIRDFGKVNYIEQSPTDPRRNLNNLPNFGLAKWHWWLLGFEVLPRAQRQFSEIIGKIKGYQTLLGESILIDDPRSPYYLNIISVREYLVPFEPVQNYDNPAALMPGLQEQIDHAHAAITSINVTVYYSGIYENLAETYRQRVVSAQSSKEAALRRACGSRCRKIK